MSEPVKAYGVKSTGKIRYVYMNVGMANEAARYLHGAEVVPVLITEVKEDDR